MRQKPAPTDDLDADLLSRVGNGDRDALGTLFASYQPKLFKFVFRLTHSYATSDELVNDIFLVVWKKAGRFRGESKVSTWIFGIAYRVTLKRITRERTRLLNTLDISTTDIASEVDFETEDWVSHAIRSLPPAQRIAVTLVFYLGLSYEETASVAGCPVNTIKTRMYHARLKLKESLGALERPNTDMEQSDA